MPNARIALWSPPVMAAVLTATLTMPSVASGTELAPEAARFTNHSAQRTVAANSTAELRVACPAGTSVVGGGVDVEGGNTFTWIHATYPYDGPDGDTRPDDGWAGAIANGTPSARRMGVHAVCAASGTFSYQQVGGSVLADTSHSRIARCGSSAKVVGGGVRITRVTKPAAVALIVSAPWDSDDPGTVHDNDWLGHVGHRYGTPLAVGYQVFAICESGSPTAALRYVRTEAKPRGGSAATPPVVASCPSSTTALSGGSLLVGPSNRFDQSIHSLGPADGPDTGTAPDDAWYSRASSPDISFLSTYAICSK